MSPAAAVVWRNEPGWPLDYASDNIRQLGYTAEEFLAGDVVYGELIHPDDMPGIEAAVEACVCNGLAGRFFLIDRPWPWLNLSRWVVTVCVSLPALA
ncbi:MAG: hypothetical protein ABR612_01580 [Chromatocurvus sp.]